MINELINLCGTGWVSGQRGIDEGGRALEFADNTQGMATTLATLRGNAQLLANVRHAAGPFATNFANLAVSDLSADAYVHGKSSVAMQFKS